MCEEAVEVMTQRITEFADTVLTKAKADMRMKPSKTCTQHLQRQEKVAAATVEEIEKKMVKYKHTCEFAKTGCSISMGNFFACERFFFHM